MNLINEFLKKVCSSSVDEAHGNTKGLFLEPTKYVHLNNCDALYVFTSIDVILLPQVFGMIEYILLLVYTSGRALLLLVLLALDHIKHAIIILYDVSSY